MDENTKISIIIPCYNSQKTISYVVQDIKTNLEGVYRYKIILVNDNSNDNVWKIIENLCINNPNIVGLSLAQNFGQQAARMAALQYVEGVCCVYG